MTNNKPLKVTAQGLKGDGYGMALSYCDGQQASHIFSPSKGQKYIPVPYYAKSVKYPKEGKNVPPFSNWNTETTIAEFLQNPPAFTYVDHKAKPKDLTPAFKTDLAKIEYLLKELQLTDLRCASGAAFFTHTRGSFSFPVVESSNGGALTYDQVREIDRKYLQEPK